MSTIVTTVGTTNTGIDANGFLTNTVGVKIPALHIGANNSEVEIVATPAEINRTCDVSTRNVAAGAALTVTELAHDAKHILLDTAAGSTCTLPAATGSGDRFIFLVSTTATSNSHIIKVANASDFMTGFIDILDLDGTTVSSYKGDGTADDTITMNRTTTGGFIGDWVECYDMKANLWHIRGKLTCAAGSNPADPLSATV
jgi:hypothetical protein